MINPLTKNIGKNHAYPAGHEPNFAVPEKYSPLLRYALGHKTQTPGKVPLVVICTLNPFS